MLKAWNNGILDRLPHHRSKPLARIPLNPALLFVPAVQSLRTASTRMAIGEDDAASAPAASCRSTANCGSWERPLRTTEARS
jgi:hypothetical protein